jgi:3-deoxy-D-manno-octulosonic-acid transferase
MSLPFYILYNILLCTFFPLFCIFLLLRGKRERAKALLFQKLPSLQGRVLLHAVSLGESVAALPLVQALKREGEETALSVTTDTAYRWAKDRFDALFFFPQDFLWSVHLLLARKPKALLFVETEIWPNLLHLAKKYRIPVFLLNARMSEEAFKKYKILKSFFTYVMGSFSLILCQTEEERRRFAFFGKDAIVCGNTKFDAFQRKEVSKELEKFLQNRSIILCGSTHEGEEEVLLDAFSLIKREKEDALLLLCPRHTNRVGKIEALIKERGLSFIRRSKICKNMKVDVLLVDTMGELSSLYALAHVAFIGGSLVKKGGHNPIEPLFFGKPILFGPNMQNFLAIADSLKRRKVAEQVEDCRQFKDTVLILLNDLRRRERIKEEAQKVVDENKGAAERMIKIVLKALKEQRE